MQLELLSMTWNFWLLCLTPLLLCYIYTRRKLYLASWFIPGPNPALPFLGNILFFLFRGGVTGVLPLFDYIVSEYANKCGLARVWIGGNLLVIVNDPEVAYQVNQKSQLKSIEYQYAAKPYLANGLFHSNDLPQYRRTRKAFLLGLSPENLRSFVPKFHQECMKVLDTFRKYSGKNESCFTTGIFNVFTLSCLIKCTMDFDVQTKDEAELVECIESGEVVMKLFQARFMIPILRSDFIFALLGLKAKDVRGIKTHLSFSKSILDFHKDKRKLQNGVKDVTQHTESSEERCFIEYLLEPDLQISEDDVLANISVMILAGTDTLGSECTMLLLLLAQNPMVQYKVHEEMVRVLREDFNICPSPEDLARLEYLDRVLKECLRLFPAAPVIGRCAPEDITVTGRDNKQYVIPQGVTIGIFIQSIQNNPLIYENPATFDPDRWLPENVAKRAPRSYLPFNNGPRRCVGGQYALLHLKTMAATVLRAFEIVPSKCCEKFEDIRVKMSLTLNVDTSCQVMFRPRARRGVQAAK